MVVKIKRFETITVKVRGASREEVLEDGMRRAKQFFGTEFELEIHSLKIEAAQTVPKTGDILEYKGSMVIGPKDVPGETGDEGYEEDDDD